MKSPLRASIEPLEPRIAPATIQGAVVGSTLKLAAISPTGAVTASLVQVDADSFDLFDVGVANPTRFDGVRNIQVVLSDATDEFDLFLGAPDNRGSISIQSGAGSDSIELIGPGGTYGDVIITSEDNSFVQIGANLALRGNTKISNVDGVFGSGGNLGNLSVTGAGFVFLSGTVAGNVKVAGLVGGVEMTANGTINGSLTVVGGLGFDSLTLSGKTDGKIRFSPGDEGSSFTTLAGFAARSSVSVIGGKTAPDSVNIALQASDPFSTVVSGPMTFALGGGNNSVSITAGIARLGAGIRVSGGDDADSVTMTGLLFIGGAVQLALGGGANSTQITDGALYGGLKYAGGSGSDYLELENTDVLAPARIALGDGENIFQALISSFDNGLQVKGGAADDALTLAGTVVYGRAVFALGDGTNSLTTQFAELRGGFVYQGGAGADTVSMDANSTFLGAAVVKGGAGTNVMFASGLSRLTSFSYIGGIDNDTVLIDNAGGTFARIKVALGDGNDLAIVQSSIFSSLRIDGGAGVDVLEHVAAAITSGLVAVGFESTNQI